MKRTRRVGSLTCGLAMVGYGVLFMLNTGFHILNYRDIFRLWPLLLIGMGAELLFTNVKYSDSERFTLIYDKGAIVLLVLVTIFAVGMGCLDYAMDVCSARIIL